MSTPVAKLGFLSANSRHGRHYDDFLRLVPEELALEMIPLGLWQDSLWDLAGKTDEHIELTTELARDKAWDGIALLGAPMQVQNPAGYPKAFAQGRKDDLETSVSLPL